MQNYNPQEESSYLMYLDANNLYGWAMSQPLPYRDFKWIDTEEIILDNYHENSNKGIILEVDLEYPEELHDLHNDYPCASEKILVADDMLSDYCRNIKILHGNSSGTVSKLIPTLNKKTNYVLHYRNLKLYQSLGLKPTKIHRVLEFKQRKWLKSYIDFNTEMRKDAKNSFQKTFFKLMNNSVFGKTMENLRKRCNVELVTDEKRLFKLTSKPTYISHKIFDENLVGVNTKKERLNWINLLMLIFITIISEKNTLIVMQLLFTDTDSRFYHIKTEGDVYEDFYQDRRLFDNSDYPKSSKFFYGENKKSSR